MMNFLHPHEVFDDFVASFLQIWNMQIKKSSSLEIYICSFYIVSMHQSFRKKFQSLSKIKWGVDLEKIFELIEGFQVQVVYI